MFFHGVIDLMPHAGITLRRIHQSRTDIAWRHEMCVCTDSTTVEEKAMWDRKTGKYEMREKIIIGILCY
jgi:hypothetical protein